MQRGEIYRVRRPANDPRSSRAFMIVSRDEFLTAPYSTVVGIPVYSNATGVHTEVPVEVNEGLPHESVLRCDEITSVPKARLTDFVGTFPANRLPELHAAILLSLAILPPASRR